VAPESAATLVFRSGSLAVVLADHPLAALTPYGLGAMAAVLAFGAYVMRTRRFATT
jgi:hypothetical protein